MVSIHRNPYLLDIKNVEIPLNILKRAALQVNLLLILEELQIPNMEDWEK
jgi:hypothetical protein